MVYFSNRTVKVIRKKMIANLERYFQLYKWQDTPVILLLLRGRVSQKSARHDELVLKDCCVKLLIISENTSSINIQPYKRHQYTLLTPIAFGFLFQL